MTTDFPAAPAPRPIGGSHLDRHHDRIDLLLTGGNPGPLAIEIGPSLGCNHHCVHCGFQQYQEWGEAKRFLDDGAFRSFLDDFRALGGAQVFFAGNGEPLLNRHVPHWITHGDALGLSMTLSTNGIALAGPAMEKTVAHADWIRFSVNGGTADVYRRIHRCREGDFDLLKRNLAAAVAFRDRHEAKARLIIQCVVFDLNAATIPQMVELHRSVGTDRLFFRNVTGRNIFGDGPVPDIVAELQEVDGLPGVEVRWNTFEAGGSVGGWEDCYGIHFRTNMDDRGNLFACNRHLIKESFFGNIHDKSFCAIWSSDEKERLFREIYRCPERRECEEICQASHDNSLIDRFRREATA
jgi:MoaA/NifB/PqqE/SkfB family radical SAM enzyme